MRYLGDFITTQTVRFTFNTRDSSGAMVAMAGSPAVSVYKDSDTSQSVAGVTLTETFDSITGLNLVTINLSASSGFYTAGSEFYVVLTTGTVDGISQVGTVLAQFSISARSTLDEAGIRSAVGLTSANLATLIAALPAVVQTGTAQAGGGSTITLASAASSTSSLYLHSLVQITSGTGAGQVRQITGYVGSTRVATVNYAWQTSPDNTSVYRVLAAHVPFSDVSGYVYALNTSGNSLATGAQASAISATLGTPAGASLSADVADVALALAVVDDYVDTEVAAIKAKTDLIPASPAAVGSAMTLADGAITSAKFTVSSISGPATGILEQLRQVWQRFFYKCEKDTNGTRLRTFAADGTTVVTTQTTSDDGNGNQVQGASS